ncbi:hypothetical protein ACHWI2_33455, partial [Klebsiella pneumoniae]
ILSDHNCFSLQSCRRQRYIFIGSGTSAFHYRGNFDRIHYDEDVVVQTVIALWFETGERFSHP